MINKNDRVCANKRSSIECLLMSSACVMRFQHLSCIGYLRRDRWACSL